jgi:hypothetical protein
MAYQPTSRASGLVQSSKCTHHKKSAKVVLVIVDLRDEFI